MKMSCEDVERLVEAQEPVNAGGCAERVAGRMMRGGMSGLGRAIRGGEGFKSTLSGMS